MVICFLLLANAPRFNFLIATKLWLKRPLVLVCVYTCVIILSYLRPHTNAALKGYSANYDIVWTLHDACSEFLGTAKTCADKSNEFRTRWGNALLSGNKSFCRRLKWLVTEGVKWDVITMTSEERIRFARNRGATENFRMLFWHHAVTWIYASFKHTSYFSWLSNCVSLWSAPLHL